MSSTETANPAYEDIDLWPSTRAVSAMLQDQIDAVKAIVGQEQAIAEASDAAAMRLRSGGRLIYAGAGTSGRIAVQDGVELGPTYGWPNSRLGFVIAGGLDALADSAEGAEDDAAAAKATLARLAVNADDVLIGIAASGKTPFTVAALTTAKAAGALTIGVANNAKTPVLASADYAIVAETGAEPIAGSTRMKAGTAQKVVLNLISTTVMIRLGRVYRGLMVDMVISNDKLLRRGQSMVMTLAGCNESTAAQALEAAGRNIKAAVLIARGVPVAEAHSVLARSGQSLRAALMETAA
jgi:N-acetylmuramic acid 6-phosphate etherase